MPSSTHSQRVGSIDLLRGVVMILMALDHCRAFLGRLGNPTDLATTTFALFTTRWLTHFCAPVFVALAGLSAALWARKVGPERAGRFLITRGLWLIVLEVTVVNFSWQLTYDRLSLLVIWALGASMVGLGLLVRLHRFAPLVVGVVLTLGHDLLAGVRPADLGALAIPWGLAFSPYSFEIGTFPVGISYSALPWLGLMALGWASASWLVGPDGVRGRRALVLGAGFVLAFVLLRALHGYGEPSPWISSDRGPVFTVLALLNCSKYPPSLQYLLMTIGPALMLFPVLERWRGRLAAPVLIFGRVPMFFYLLHIPIIHVASGIWFHLNPGADGTPEPSLVRIYAGWLVLLVLLYPLCQAWGRLKAARRWWWLRYL